MWFDIRLFTSRSNLVHGGIGDRYDTKVEQDGNWLLFILISWCVSSENNSGVWTSIAIFLAFTELKWLGISLTHKAAFERLLVILLLEGDRLHSDLAVLNNLSDVQLPLTD